MPKKSKRRKKKQNQKNKTQGEGDDVDFLDEDMSLTSETTASSAQDELKDDNEDKWEEEIFEILDNLNSRKKEERLGAIQNLLKYLTRGYNDTKHELILNHFEQLEESYFKELRRADAEDEVHGLMKIFPVFVVAFYNEFEDEYALKLIDTLERKFERSQSLEIKLISLRSIALIHFLFLDESQILEKSLSYFKKNYIAKKKTPEAVLCAGIRCFSFLCSSFDADIKEKRIFNEYSPLFLGFLKKAKRFMQYEAIGEFYSLIYNDNTQLKRKQDLIFLFDDFIKTSRSLKKEEKKSLRKYLNFLKNETTVSETFDPIQIDKNRGIDFQTWSDVSRYMFLKNVLKGNTLKNFLSVNKLSFLSKIMTVGNTNRTRRSKYEKNLSKIGFSERALNKDQF